MPSMSVIFLTFSLVFTISRCEHDRAHRLQNFVLMPIQFADKILDKDIKKVEKVKKLSYALLQDLQENREKYPNQVVSRTFARVIEEGADALSKSLRDIHNLVYPNRVI